MLTYVVTTNRAQLLDYCEHARLHPRCVRLVRFLADLEAADLGVDRLVFWGDFKHLRALPAIQQWALSQVLQNGHVFEKIDRSERQRGLPFVG